MRSLETLINEYPSKTGAELLIIQKQDREDDEAAAKKRNENKINFIEDINKNGGFFKGVSGGQKYYYNITEVELFDGVSVYGNKEKIICFFGSERGILEEGTLSFEISIDKSAS